MCPNNVNVQPTPVQAYGHLWQGGSGTPQPEVTALYKWSVCGVTKKKVHLYRQIKVCLYKIEKFEPYNNKLNQRIRTFEFHFVLICEIILNVMSKTGNFMFSYLCFRLKFKGICFGYIYIRWRPLPVFRKTFWVLKCHSLWSSGTNYNFYEVVGDVCCRK